MAAPVAIFTADNHLRPRTWVNYPELTADAYVSFRQIINACVQRGLPLLQLGDLFDKTYPDSKSVAEYMREIGELQKARLDFFYIQGNHDHASPPWASLHPWARPVAQLAIDGVRFYGIDFRNRESLEPALKSDAVRQADVVLAHQSWKQIQRTGSSDGDFAMFEDRTVLLTGDYHETNVYRGTAANGEEVLAYSPGSTCMQATNEPPEKFYGVIHDDLSVTWEPIDTRPYIKWTTDNEESFSHLIAAIPEIIAEVDRSDRSAAIRKPILHVAYAQQIPEACTRLKAAAEGLCHLFESPFHREEVQVVDDLATPENAFESLVSAVAELCHDDPETLNDTKRLLDANDPREELEKMFRESMH